MAGDFSPADHSVDEVNKHLEGADADEVARVLAAEAESDKPRKGIVEGPHAAPAKEDEQGAEVVLVPFAYATAKNGEVVQLVKGDVILDRFEKKSLDHLRDIGFIGSSK